jgi:hypothetical protein
MRKQVTWNDAEERQQTEGVVVLVGYMQQYMHVTSPE